MKLMWKHTTPAVVESVQDQTTKAEHLARIPGQDRLTDPRTNPAVRPHADHLRDVQHKLLLDAEHARIRRRYRVEARHAGHAEKALQAIQEAREVSSPAKSVRVLHTRRNVYMWVSLATSLALAGGSAVGLEKVAEDYRHIPEGTGVVAELGLTGLATLVILARSDLAQHGATLKKSDWRNWTLWALMIVPLAASMAANIHGGNFIGALCAAGAAAFSLFSFLVGVLFADAAKAQAKLVTGSEEVSLRRIATGGDLFSAPAKTAPETEQSAPAIGSFEGTVPAGPNRSATSRSDRGRSETHRSDLSGSEEVQSYGSRTQVSDLTADGSETHEPDRSAPETTDPVPVKPKTQTGPKKQTGPKTDPLDRIDEARAVDKAYLAEHGRHIPAEKLRQALSIGKRPALELVKQIRGGHIDIAK